MPLSAKATVKGTVIFENVPLPTAVSNCQLCDVTVEPFVVIVGVAGFNDPPAHNAAGAEIAAIVGLSFTVNTTRLLFVVPQPFVAV